MAFNSQFAVKSDISNGVSTKPKKKEEEKLVFGSQGEAVVELKDLLKQNGYDVTDGDVFDAHTHLAVKRYQNENGLNVDGWAGPKTLAALTESAKSTVTGNTGGSTGGSSGSTAIPITPEQESAYKDFFYDDGGSTGSTGSTESVADAVISAILNSGTLPTAPKYDSTLWGDTERGKNALAGYEAAKEALNKHGKFEYDNETWLNDIMTKIMNREPFSYDFNGDALYQQYKDKYIQQGKMAMQDTMGQAAAMTGGYGSSYAATAGNQAYQAALQNLNDVIPELYAMAYDRYNQEGQDLYNRFSMLLEDYARKYGEHSDEYNKLVDMLGIERSDYYDGADMFYNEQSNKNSIAGQTFSDAFNLWQAQNDNAWKQAEFEEGVRQFDKNYALTEKKYNDSLIEDDLVEDDEEEDGTLVQGGSKEPELPDLDRNRMSFNREEYEKNVREHGGSYYNDVLEDLKDMKLAGRSNEYVQNYLSSFVASSYLTGTESRKLYQLYTGNNLI